MDNRIKRWFYIFMVILVASLGGFLFGYDETIVAGALPFLTKHFHLSPAAQGFAVSSLKIGTIVGPLCGLWFSERLGRRRTMIIAAICFIISAVGSALAATIWDFAIWRLVGGVGIGLAMMTSPIYIAELSPAHLRGSLVNVNQLADVLGIVLAATAGYFFSFPGWGWRWMFGSEAVPSILLMAGLFLIPESPRWLVGQGRSSEARNILTKISGHLKVEDKVAEIQSALEKEAGGLGELFRPGMKAALMIAIILMVFSQINGVNMILLYAPTILGHAGIQVGTKAILSSLPVFIFIFICTIIAFWLIRRFSRRGLLMTSVLGMAAGHAVMAVGLQTDWPPIYTLIPMLIGTGAFTLGFAPLSWVIVSEFFPNRIRSRAMGVVCLFMYSSSFLTALFFPVLTHQLAGRAYWIFFGICLACVGFVWKWVPETKGMSLEKVQELWQTNTNTHSTKGTGNQSKIAKANINTINN